MASSDEAFAPYAPGAPTVAVVRRIREGTTGGNLSLSKLMALGIAEGNAIRVQRALRYLNLIDEGYELTESARRLRKATDAEYQPQLAEIIRGAYGLVFEILPDPSGASGIELSNAFRQFDPAGQRDNMIRLFVALCQEAALIGATAPEAKPKGRPAATERKGITAATITVRRKPKGAESDALIQALMAKFPEFNPEWTPEVQAKWFEAFESLRDRLKGD